MKTDTEITNAPPFPDWTACKTSISITVPDLNSDTSVEVETREVDAWKDEHGNIVLTPQSMELIEKITFEHLAILPAESLRKLRKFHDDISQSEISELLQIGKKTWTRWESGDSDPSRSLNLLVRLVWEGLVSPDELRVLGNTPLSPAPRKSRYAALREELSVLKERMAELERQCADTSAPTHMLSGRTALPGRQKVPALRKRKETGVARKSVK